MTDERLSCDTVSADEIALMREALSIRIRNGDAGLLPHTLDDMMRLDRKLQVLQANGGHLVVVPF